MLHLLWYGYYLSENSYNIYEFANLEIAKWAEYYLGQKIALHQSSWYAGKVTERAEDILLGHPTWDARHPKEKTGIGKLLHNWVKENALNSTNECHPNTYIMMPWVPEFPIEWTDNMPFYESQLLAARKIFGLGGEIWYKRTFEKADDSIQYRVKDKLIQCNMGIAAENFKIVKQRFNNIGDRQLIHISHLGTYKGFDITCKSVKGLDTILHIASPSIQAPLGLVEIALDGEEYLFNFIGNISNTDPEFNQWVVDNCDFYIHTATMDAQATTILENAARGLIPLVTPESGFSSPHAIYLTHDPSENQKIIEWALNLPETELLNRSHLLREQILKEHSWETIFNKIWAEIQADIEMRKVKETNIFMSDSPNATKVDQRLYISHDQLIKIENQVRLERHIERYALLRQFAKGVVCDAACGCGYGSYLLSTNPDVKKVIGLDFAEDAINYANQEYARDNLEFHVANLADWVFDTKIDMLISVETIEHIKDTMVLPKFVDRNSINHVILTYPSKKTSHYNPYHYYDFKLQDILDLFSSFTCYRHFNWEYEFDVVFLIRNPPENA